MRFTKAIYLFAIVWIIFHIGLVVMGFRYFSDGLISTTRFGDEVPFKDLIKRESLILIPTFLLAALLFLADKKRR